MTTPTRPSQPPPPPQQPPFSPSPQQPSFSPSPPPSHELELTLISGKHLKNVNWKNGNLKPYAILWVDPDHKLTTKSDDSGNTKPIWNQRLLIPIPPPQPHTTLSLEIFHSITSQTPKPFVGSLQILLSDLPDPTNHTLVRTHPLLRPSGRPQGKIRFKLAIKENYQNTPHFSTVYPLSYSGYFPPPPSLWYGAPSAPVEYGVEVGVGAVAGALGGMVLEDGVRSEERVGDNFGGKDDFCGYRAGY